MLRSLPPLEPNSNDLKLFHGCIGASDSLSGCVGHVTLVQQWTPKKQRTCSTVGGNHPQKCTLGFDSPSCASTMNHEPCAEADVKTITESGAKHTSELICEEVFPFI